MFNFNKEFFRAFAVVAASVAGAVVVILFIHFLFLHVFGADERGADIITGIFAIPFGGLAILVITQKMKKK